MQRRALAQAAAAAAVLAVALAGCTGSDGPTGAVDSQSGEAGASSVPAPSGKYSTLPEPCTAVSTGTLEELLPGAEEESEESEESGEDAEEALAGEPDLTYDADRLVGCSWERETTEGGHQLELRFERIVSYDDEISDDEQAAQIYAERADEHDVDVTDDPPDLPDKAGTGNASGGGPASGGAGATVPQDGAAEGGPDAADDGGTDGDGTDGDGTDGEGTPAGSSGSSESPGDDGEGDDPAATLAPRLLDGIGDESFLDDRTVGAGKQREVTVVFRTSNVVVTLTYDHWDTAAAEPPGTAELQQRAQQVAEQLADRLAG